MKTNSILLACVTYFLASCGSGNGDKSTAATAAHGYDNSLAKGVVIDSIICQNRNSESYALYLPSYYSSTKKFPCIYFFDSHARGSLPLKLYKALAEEYGFVLAGSNVSKNGMQWQETNDVASVLMEDARNRINIDPQRIYTAGFSGGARVASTIAILDGGVAGVIGCAAGFPQVEHEFENKFDYFGMVGNYDFNLTEMEKLNDALQQAGFAHQLLTFDGKHDWAPVTDFRTGMLWLQVNGMKKSLQPKNDSLIMAFKNDYDMRIAAAKTDDIITEQQLLDGIVKALEGLSDISSYKKQLADLIADADFKNAVTAQAKSHQMELEQQQELAKQFTEHDEKWWAEKIAVLNKNINNAKTKRESQMYKRLLNFLGLIGYLNSNHALNSGDLTNAPNYLKVFKMADPQNPDCSYLSAVYFMKSGNRKQAIYSLNEAASLGFSDVLQLMTDAAFTDLRDDAGFKDVAAKVRENYSAK